VSVGMSAEAWIVLERTKDGRCLIHPGLICDTRREARELRRYHCRHFADDGETYSVAKVRIEVIDVHP